MAEQGRGPGGRFLPGNSGRPPGAVSTEKRAIAQICRDLLEGNGSSLPGEDGSAPGVLWQTAEVILGAPPKSVTWAGMRLEFMKVLLAYGYGKPPVKVTLGEEDSSPDGILRELMRKRNQELGERGGAAGAEPPGEGDGGQTETPAGGR